MDEKCVYIVVVDSCSRHEQASEPRLHQVANFADPESHVLIVTNWFDDIKTQQNRSALIRKFPSLLDQSVNVRTRTPRLARHSKVRQIQYRLVGG